MKQNFSFRYFVLSIFFLSSQLTATIAASVQTQSQDIRVALDLHDAQVNNQVEAERDFIRAILRKRGVVNVDTLTITPSQAYMVFSNYAGCQLLYNQSEVAKAIEHPENIVLKNMITFVLFHEGSHLINNDIRNIRFFGMGASLMLSLVGNALYHSSKTLQQKISPLILSVVFGVGSVFATFPLQLMYRKWLERRADIDAARAANNPTIIRSGAVWFEQFAHKMKKEYGDSLVGKILKLMRMDWEKIPNNHIIFEFFHLSHPAPYRRAAYLHDIADELEAKNVHSSCEKL